MARHYNETDLTFHAEREVHEVRVDVTTKGNVISWNPVEGMAGYAIYKGKGNTIKYAKQRFIKIVVKKTQNDIYNKDEYYPSRQNVAVSEIELYANGSKTDITNMIPERNFTASSSWADNTTAKEAFNDLSWESPGRGWQSQKVRENPRGQEELFEWIQIDLGTPLDIDKVRIQNSSDSLGLCGIQEYRIEASIDGFYWSTIHQGTLNQDSAFQDILLEGKFYKDRAIDEDWELIETVGSATTRYVDGIADYYDNNYRVTAIVTGDIDFEAGADGLVDLKITDQYGSATQDIDSRIRSQKGQWKFHPNLGSNLELIEGMKNTRETAAYGTELIEESLTFDGRFEQPDLSIRPVPKSITQVDYYVMAETEVSDEPILFVKNMEM